MKENFIITIQSMHVENDYGKLENVRNILLDGRGCYNGCGWLVRAMLLCFWVAGSRFNPSRTIQASSGTH